jgi:hypothetical protein
MRSPLDQHRLTQIEVSIVCMNRSVSTRYVKKTLRACLGNGGFKWMEED